MKDNNYFEVRNIMSKVANDNSVPMRVWFHKFFKMGILIALLVGIFIFLS